MTDKRGNLLPVQTTDLRAVPDWVHAQGPNIRRFALLDVPKAVVDVYRKISPEVRGNLIDKIGGRGSSSHDAQASLSAGGGWKAVLDHALPHPSAHGGPFDWEHYK